MREAILESYLVRLKDQLPLLSVLQSAGGRSSGGSGAESHSWRQSWEPGRDGEEGEAADVAGSDSWGRPLKAVGWLDNDIDLHVPFKVEMRTIK